LTVWLTGLSSAGKTTLANVLAENLSGRGYRTEKLDGDVIRQCLCRDLGFTKEDRDENVRRIAFVAELLTRNGVIVLVSAVSPYRAARSEARRSIGRFVEVHVTAPMEVLEQRDTHGIYERARAAQLTHVAGIDDPYEPPLSPDVQCQTDVETPAESAAKILSVIDRWLFV
jgi:adenylylsulfate kinase